MNYLERRLPVYLHSCCGSNVTQLTAIANSKGYLYDAKGQDKVSVSDAIGVRTAWISTHIFPVGLPCCPLDCDFTSLHLRASASSVAFLLLRIINSSIALVQMALPAPVSFYLPSYILYMPALFYSLCSWPL